MTIEKENLRQESTAEVGIHFLGQAGFLFLTPNGKRIVIDAYLSDAAQRLFGFKRMVPAVIAPNEIQADLWLSTHEHIDHLDVDVLPILYQDKNTKFIGAPDCKKYYQELGFDDSRYNVLAEGEQWCDGEVQIRAIFADHGELAPEAIGLLIEFSGIRIYHTGDTAFRPDQILASLDSAVDIMIAPINGTYGNMNAKEACQLAQLIKPTYLIPAHFWMFVEHVTEGGAGDPATFLQEAKLLLDQSQPYVMAPGESRLFKLTRS